MAKKEIIDIIDFRGGLNDTSAPDNMADNELVQADNIELSTRGGFSYRPGTRKINETSFNGDITQLIEFPLKNGDVKLLAVINKALYDITNNAKTKLVDVAIDKIGYVFHRNKMYFVDGSKYRVYENSTTDDGIPNTIKEVSPKGETTNDLAPIAKCTLLILHPKSLRVLAAGNPGDIGAVYISEISEPNFFKETNKIYPTNGDGPVNALTVLGKSVLVGYKHSWWEYTGLDPQEDATWNQLPTPHGVVSNNTVALTPASITFLSNDGIYQMSVGILNQDIILNTTNSLVFNVTDGKVEKLVDSIKNHKNTCAVFHDEKYYLAYSDTEGSKENNKILVFDNRLKSFVRYTGINANTLIKNLNNELLIGSKNYLLHLDKSELNDTDSEGNIKPIEFNVKTKRFNFGTPINQKLIHRFFFSSSQDVDIGNKINVTLRIDFAMAKFLDVDLNNESFIWGHSTWGKVWGIADIGSQEAKIRKKGIRTQVMFSSNNINTRNPVKIYGVAFEIETLRARTKRINDGRLFD